MKIALSGKSGAGKTTLADILHKKYGFKIVHTGEKYRQLCKSIYGYTEKSLMNKLTHTLREIDSNIMIHLLGDDILLNDKIVIDSVRFEDDAKFLKKNGYIIVRLESPLEKRLNRLAERQEIYDKSLDEKDQTEIDLDLFSYDFTISNDNDYLNLENQVDVILNNDNDKFKISDEEIDADYLKFLIFSKRNASYFSSIVNRYALNLSDIKFINDIVLIGGLSSQEFVVGFSDIDLIITTTESYSENILQNSLILSRSLFLSQYFNRCISPLIFTPDDFIGSINPFFSQNIITDIDRTAKVIRGNNLPTSSLTASQSIGFIADAYLFRLWIRRKLIDPYLILSVDIVYKAILRWLKVTIIYAQRIQILDPNSQEYCKVILKNIEYRRKHFAVTNSEEKLAFFLQMASFFDYLCTSIISNKVVEKINVTDDYIHCIKWYKDIVNYFPINLTDNNYGLYHSEISELELVLQDDIFP